MRTARPRLRRRRRRGFDSVESLVSQPPPRDPDAPQDFTEAECAEQCPAPGGPAAVARSADVATCAPPPGKGTETRSERTPALEQRQLQPGERRESGRA